jgi:hypothetical protein
MHWNARFRLKHRLGHGRDLLEARGLVLVQAEVGQLGRTLRLNYQAAAAAIPLLPLRHFPQEVAAPAECSRIDECQTWADRAEALASYAKQADDDSLRKLADRIQTRAVRRCGELLKQIPSAQGERTDVEPREGDRPKLTRTEAADAGLSERQKVTTPRWQSPSAWTISVARRRGRSSRHRSP